MYIAAKFEDGVFKPLDGVRLAEGTIVQVRVDAPGHGEPGPKVAPSLEGSPFLGLWKDREDMADSVEYVNKMRARRRF